MTDYHIIPPKASIDEIVEVVLKAFSESDEGIIADVASEDHPNTIVVYGINEVLIGDIPLKVESFPDELGTVVEQEEMYDRGRVTDRINALHVRRGPSTRFSSIRTIPKGTEVVILEELTTASSGKWLRVDVDGLEGFVYALLIERI